MHRRDILTQTNITLKGKRDAVEISKIERCKKIIRDVWLEEDGRVGTAGCNGCDDGGGVVDEGGGVVGHGTYFCGGEGEGEKREGEEIVELHLFCFVFFFFARVCMVIQKTLP